MVSGKRREGEYLIERMKLSPGDFSFTEPSETAKKQKEMKLYS